MEQIIPFPDLVEQPSRHIQARDRQGLRRLILQIGAPQSGEVHIIPAVVIAASRDDTVGIVYSHFSQQKLEGFGIDILVINKANGIAYTSSFYAFGNLFNKTSAKIAIYIQFGIARNFYHVGRDTFVIENVENVVQTVAN